MQRQFTLARSFRLEFARFVLLAWAWIGLANVNLAQQAESTLDKRISDDWQTKIQPLMQKHCGDCHMQGNNEGGVNLDDYKTLERIREHESTWEQVRGVIRAAAMPPPEDAKISNDERKVLSDWIQTALHEVDCGCADPPAQVTLRRLNQVEYDNTIRDLFQIDLHPSKEIGFVSDDVGNGFDNQGEVLTLPPILLEKYMQAASHIAKNLVQLDREKYRRQYFDGEPITYQNKFKVDMRANEGEYLLQVRMRFGDRQPDKCQVRLVFDGQEIALLDVPTKDETYRYDLSLSRGSHQLTIEYKDDDDPSKKGDSNRRLFIESVRFTGPKKGQPAFPAYHESLVIATPDQSDSADGPKIGSTEASRRVFARLLPLAYRRPVSEQEIQAVVSICEHAGSSGFSYEESLRFGIQAVLVSPNFLFRNEQLDQEQRIDDYAIANRMSYFLWSSMPDDELFQAAQDKKLRDPKVRSEQIARMLQSPKSDAIISGFFSQWLGLRNIAKIDIDRDKYPMWNQRLRNALIKETEMFCKYLLRDGKIDDIIEGDFTWVNPRLAEYYGIQYEGKKPEEMYRRGFSRRSSNERREGSYDQEDDWIKVTLTQNRLGMLTQGSVLALTSNPTRTSPVKRGKWILETVLGDPPPSAPPNVPSLESVEHKTDASLRDRLEIHRSNPSCAGCHKLMDPIGLGLENFDAIGRWRDQDGNINIDARGELSDGRTFAGPKELVSLLSTRKEQILENLASRMLTYALGRGLQRQDKCDLDRIVKSAHENGRTIKSVVEAIIASDSFLQNPTFLATGNPNQNVSP